MEFVKDVNEVLGKENVDNLLKEIRNGRIKKSHIKDIALLMDVYRTFVKHTENDSLDNIVRLMLDEWYKKYLFEHNDNGLADLKTILKDQNVGLNYIAIQMKSATDLGKD